MKDLLIIISFLVIVGIIVYGVWEIDRYLNYSFYYKEQVQTEIKELVKKECLK